MTEDGFSADESVFSSHKDFNTANEEDISELKNANVSHKNYNTRHKDVITGLKNRFTKL